MKLEDILEIISTKDDKLMQVDLNEIDYMITQLDIDEALEVQPMVYEAISNIVNDPLYEGDIEPIQ